MAWTYLLVAGLLEIVWALLLKQSGGFSRLWPSVGFLVSLAGSMALLGLALRTLPVGTAHAIWTGIGAAGTSLLGILWLSESRDALKLVSLMLILAGIVGLRFSAE